MREHPAPDVKAIVATILVRETEVDRIREDIFERYGRQQCKTVAVGVRDAVDEDLPRNHFTDEELAQIDR